MKRFHRSDNDETVECDATIRQCPKDHVEAPTLQEGNDKFEELNKHQAGGTFAKITRKEKKTRPANVYDVNTDGFEKVQHSIDKANRRLERAGIEERFELDTREYNEIVTDKHGKKFQDNRIEFTLNHPQISYNDFTFQARVEQVGEDQYVALAAPGVELEGWQPEHMECEHCNKKIARTKVYAVKDSEGNMKTVGGKCVELYTGLKPSNLWALDYSLDDELDDTDYERNYNYNDQVEPVDDLLAVAYAVSEEDGGYRNRDYGGDSTADRVDEVLYGGNMPMTSDQAEIARYGDRMREKADKVDVDEIKEEIRDSLKGSNNTWANTVRTLLDSEHVTKRSRNILISSMAALHKSRKKKAWAEGYLGKPKDKLESVNAEIVKIDRYENNYGYNAKPMYYITLKTESGHNVLWKTSSDNIPDGQVNKNIVFNATVAEQKRRGSIDSTRIVRPKWEYVEE